MENITMTEILKEVKELDIQYITFTGFYSNKDDGEELHKHTYITETLYNKGFHETFKGTLLENEDVFNGVCFDTNGVPLAEWWINGTEEYFRILL